MLLVLVVSVSCLKKQIYDYLKLINLSISLNITYHIRHLILQSDNQIISLINTSIARFNGQLFFLMNLKLTKKDNNKSLSINKSQKKDKCFYNCLIFKLLFF
jgi:hypothetical protein